MSFLKKIMAGIRGKSSRHLAELSKKTEQSHILGDYRFSLNMYLKVSILDSSDKEQTFILRGAEAQILYCLYNRGEAGITKSQIAEWIKLYHLSSVVHRLRSRFKLDINMHFSQSEGRQFGVYTLRSPIKILQIG